MNDEEIVQELKMDGKFYSVLIQPARKEGYFTISRHDITDRKQAEEEKEEAIKQLELANKEEILSEQTIYL
jgi:hypothetical protein